MKDRYIANKIKYFDKTLYKYHIVHPAHTKKEVIELMMEALQELRIQEGPRLDIP